MNTNISVSSALAILTCMLFSLSVSAQTAESGPWWPNDDWGPEDQAGASNRITEEKVMEALQVATTGKIYELGQVYERGMPMGRSLSYSIVLRAKGEASGENRSVSNNEFIASEIGHVGTQFDGLGHVGEEVTMADGGTEYVFYNGYTSAQMDTRNGLQVLGIEHVRPIVTRGLLIDIAGYKGVQRLPNSYEVTVEDVLGALERQGMSAADVRSGDAVLFRYGWSSLWDQPEAYRLNAPGIGLDVARWVIEREITLVGSDSGPTEVVPNPDPNLSFPVHQELVMKNGIFNVERMQFDELVADGVHEFLFIVTPLRLKGAAGSPVRPIAIR